MNDFITVPERGESNMIQSMRDRYFNQRRIKKLTQLKAGFYIRVHFQPLFANGRMLSFSVESVIGKPFVVIDQHDKRRNWKVWQRKTDRWPNDNRQMYVDDMGVRERIGPYGAVIFRFSNDLLLRLEAVREQGDFASWCWFHGVSSTEDTYREFETQVSWEREMDRAMDSAYDFDDRDYDATYDDHREYA